MLDEKEKDLEDNCIKSFLTKKYGTAYPDRQGMDEFKKYLCDFKDRRVFNVGEEKQYREIVKFLVQHKLSLWLYPLNESIEI